MWKEVNAISKWIYVIAIVIIILIAGLAYYFAMPRPVKPIVIGYVGDAGSISTKPCMEAVALAVEEINAAGGILGRPVKFVVGNGRGTTDLSVSEARRLVMEEGATLLFVESRSEIASAVQEACADMFPEYPHVLFTAAMDSALTAKVIENYDRYKFVFRIFDPEIAHYSLITNIYNFFKAINATKVALLFEGLAWTASWRPPEIGGKKVQGWENLPDWKQLAEGMGLQVVYCKALAPKEPNYLPILETIAATGAEVILYVSSTFTNTDVYAMQWAMSSAKNIPTCLYGGAQQTRAFWSMTLGKCLGLITPFFEPTEEETGNHWPAEHYQLLKKAEEKGIPLQHNVHFSYAAVYLFKKAIEKVGKTDDINALINAIETTEVQSSLGKLKFQSEKVSPFYHSHILCDPHDPTKLLVGYFVPNLAQWQYDPVAKKPKIVMLNHIYDYNWDTLEAWTPDASRYIPPAVLRGG